MDLSSLGSSALSTLIIMAALVLCAVFVVLVTYMGLRWRQQTQIKCIIFGKDAFGQTTINFDEAGIYLERSTNSKRFFMKNAKVGLNPDNIKLIYYGSKKYAFLIRLGQKNYRPLTMKMPSPESFNILVGEEDVNWALYDYEKAKKTLSQSTLLQYMPYIIVFFAFIIIIIIFVYFFKEIGVLRDVAVAFKDAAKELAKARLGTTVIGG